MIKHITRAVLAMILATAVTLTPIAPVKASTYYDTSNCDQSSWMGTRVCVDYSTGFGAVVIVYDSPTHQLFSTGYYVVCSLGSPGAPRVYTPAEWTGWSGHTFAFGNGTIDFSTSSVSAGAGGCYTPSGIEVPDSFEPILEWYAGAPGDSAGYELVITR